MKCRKCDGEMLDDGLGLCSQCHIKLDEFIDLEGSEYWQARTAQIEEICASLNGCSKVVVSEPDVILVDGIDGKGHYRFVLEHLAEWWHFRKTMVELGWKVSENNQWAGIEATFTKR